MINFVHVYANENKVKQGRQSRKADSEKNTELPRTGFEPVTTACNYSGTIRHKTCTAKRNG